VSISLYVPDVWCMQAVGEAPQGEEDVLHEQVRKILQVNYCDR
jgi:hypothetical protein